MNKFLISPSVLKKLLELPVRLKNTPKYCKFKNRSFRQEKSNIKN